MLSLVRERLSCYDILTIAQVLQGLIAGLLTDIELSAEHELLSHRQGFLRTFIYTFLHIF